MIEHNFDVKFVAKLALREKQIQQYYRPIIAVHKWFARRPGTLFRSLILAEFCEKPLSEVYYLAHDFKKYRILDPFMGGGTPLIEANRVGCDVIGIDINPMAYWVTREELESIDIQTYKDIAEHFLRRLEQEIGMFYKTTCTKCGFSEADVKYFLWVKTYRCSKCGCTFDLFPGYLLAKKNRHPNYVVLCSECGELNEEKNLNFLNSCKNCGSRLSLEGFAKRSQAKCPKCGTLNRYPNPDVGPPCHRMFAIEYYCPRCKPLHKGRFFKRPDDRDLELYKEVKQRLANLQVRFIPDEEIRPGDETNRLLRWGYRYYRDMFNERQLLGLEFSAQIISEILDLRIKRALITNFSDLLRYQNMLCRYDPMALKSLDIFSIHGFPVSLIQCESNILGVVGINGSLVGSGGWRNIFKKYIKAKSYCESPYEFEIKGKHITKVIIKGEWIGDQRNGHIERNIKLECCDARSLQLPPKSVDAVFTDPPYYGNVQYAELMEFCYVWLRKLMNFEDPVLSHEIRSHKELTVNTTLARGLENFTAGLSQIFQRATKALKPGRPLVFTYHHNKIEAYYPVAVAILDARLICTKTFPCPAEMGGSIHINGTQSSILDTVFICRHSYKPKEKDEDIIPLVLRDVSNLQEIGMSLKDGDLKCLLYGHMTRITIKKLYSKWSSNLSITEKLKLVRDCFDELGNAEAILNKIKNF